jgi:hypothetical protein
MGNVTQGLEVYIYYDEAEDDGETEKVTVSSNGIAYESVDNTPTWKLLGFERGFNYTEESDPIIIFDHERVAEIKKPRWQEPKMTMSQLYTNMADSIYELGDKKLYFKTESLDDGNSSLLKEILYFTGVRLNTRTLNKPEEDSVMSNIEAIYLLRGRAANTWAMLEAFGYKLFELEGMDYEDIE